MFLTFQLFRVQVFLPPQRSLFQETADLHISQYLEEMMREGSSSETHTGEQRWHAGNLERVDEDGLYFRFGKDRTITGARYEADRFIDEAIDTGAYTHVLLDTKLEIAAIARNSALSSESTAVARQFERFLSGTQFSKTRALTISVSAIVDPAELIALIRQSVYIRRFRVEITRPNAFDVNEDFIRPGQRALEYLGGEKGQSDVSGHHLDPERIVEVTRSAASVGTDAFVWLRLPWTSRAIKKRLHGNDVLLSTDVDLASPGWERAFDQIRATYRKIRHG